MAVGKRLAKYRKIERERVEHEEGKSEKKYGLFLESEREGEIPGRNIVERGKKKHSKADPLMNGRKTKRGEGILIAPFEGKKQDARVD